MADAYFFTGFSLDLYTGGGWASPGSEIQDK